MDNIILAAPSESVDDILGTFKSLHIRFTVEVCTNERVSFLDTLLVVEEGRLVLDGYRKAIFSGRFLNFNSHHLVCHKKGIIYKFINKIVRLCHPWF